ncbi:hypothetical protein ACKS23_11794 [Histoplasma ohiense]
MSKLAAFGEKDSGSENASNAIYSNYDDSRQDYPCIRMTRSWSPQNLLREDDFHSSHSVAFVLQDELLSLKGMTLPNPNTLVSVGLSRNSTLFFFFFNGLWE